MTKWQVATVFLGACFLMVILITCPSEYKRGCTDGAQTKFNALSAEIKTSRDREEKLYREMKNLSYEIDVLTQSTRK